MTVSIDLSEIRNRFIDEWPSDIQTTYSAGVGVDMDESKPYVRFSIQPGDNALVAGSNTGGLYSQLGRVVLQIFVPAQGGTATAFEIADQFVAVFRNWRVGNLRTGDHDLISIPGGENGMFQVNVSIRWESLRRP